MPETANTSEINEVHAHVYFDFDDEEDVTRAVAVCETARDTLDVSMGRVHRKPVGPHPRGSCQLAFDANRFGEVILWLSMNRNGLTVFVHLETGSFRKDHTDHVIWLGDMDQLNLPERKEDGAEK